MPQIQLLLGYSICVYQDYPGGQGFTRVILFIADFWEIKVTG